MTNPFGHNPFEPIPTQPPPAAAYGPPPPGPPSATNTLATLSVVFAFLFAPAGAILGHFGLDQIRRTGQPGRDRALVGVTLSYVVIVVALVSVVVWATLPDNTTIRQAASPTTIFTTTAALVPPLTTTSAPPPPTVAPADVDGLLPSLDDVKRITGDQGMTLLRTYHVITRDPDSPSNDHPECVGAVAIGDPSVYDTAGILGFSSPDMLDKSNPRKPWQAAEAVSVFRDAAAAQAQLTKLQLILRQCGGTTMTSTFSSGLVINFSLSAPVDAGDGITTMEPNPQGLSIHITAVHAIAAKANVVIEVLAVSTTDRTQQAAVDITKYILGKIPG